jgi:hypothetical protein
MSKTVRAIAITAAICIPLGAFGKDALKGHPNLQKARAALNDADSWITASQKANEWTPGTEGGHGQKAKEAISLAKDELRQAAEYLDSHQ